MPEQVKIPDLKNQEKHPEAVQNTETILPMTMKSKLSAPLSGEALQHGKPRIRNTMTLRSCCPLPFPLRNPKYTSTCKQGLFRDPVEYRDSIRMCL
jgi:hypothetical protein